MVRPFRRAASVGLVLAALGGTAAAQDAPGDPRDLFGLGEVHDAPATCAEATALPCPFDARDGDRGGPAALTTTLAAARLERLPLVDAGLDVVAQLVVGAGRDDTGAFFGGATGVENRWLLDGAPIDSPRTGALSTRVPLYFLDRVIVTTGGFSARDPAATGAVVDARLREGGDHTRIAGHAWIGAGATPRSTARVRGEYRPFEGRFDDLRTVSAVALADGPLVELGGARLWWVAGVAPRLDDQTLVRDTWRRVDRDGMPGADEDAAGRVVHEHVGTIERDAVGWSVPVLARLGARTAHTELATTALVTAARDQRWQTLGEASAAGIERDLLTADLIATWRGRWGRTAAEVQASWHREAVDEGARAGGDLPSHGFAYVPAPADGVTGGDLAVRQACADGIAGDDFPDLFNCPFATGYYLTGGVGRLTDTVADRPRVRAELTTAAGGHALSAGVSGEDARVVIRQRFSGGRLRHQLGEGAFIDYRMVELGQGAGFTDTCGDGIACRWLDEHERTVRTRHVAAWLADTWRPGTGIEVEYGVRAESSQIGESVVARDLLPRIGAAWDFLGQGRSRAFAGWGRYAAVLPAGAGEHIFGGPAIYQEVTFGDQFTTGLAAPGGLAIDPDLRGVRVDEAVAGVEVGVADAVRLGVAAQYRHLGRALEDDQGQLTTGGARTGVAATRDFTQVQATLETSPVAQVTVRTGYAWSRLRGNWPGPWDPFEGLTLYGSSLFDAAPINRTGDLPGDQPSRFFAEVAGRGHAWGLAIDASLRATAASGRPISVRASGGSSPFLVSRGAAGRLPTVAQTNVHLDARRGRVTVSLDVFNLFDRRGVLAVDEVYTPDDTTPIDGGTLADLVFLKDSLFEGEEPRINRRFGQPTRFQAPVAAYLGVHVDL